MGPTEDGSGAVAGGPGGGEGRAGEGTGVSYGDLVSKLLTETVKPCVYVCVCARARAEHRGDACQRGRRAGRLLGKLGASSSPVQGPFCQLLSHTSHLRETQPQLHSLHRVLGNSGPGHVSCRGLCQPRSPARPPHTGGRLCPHPLLAGPRRPRGLAPARVSLCLLFISAVLDT